AVEVAAALPGGDPLAAAVAAGETPSPQMVAHAGGTGGLQPRTGAALLSLALLGIALAVWLNEHVRLHRQMPSDLSPRELRARAHSLLQQLGYAERDDWACGVSNDSALLGYLYDNAAWPWWEKLGTGQPPAMYFWYRQGPGQLAQRLAPADTTGWSMAGRVLPNEPPLRQPGMACVFLDLRGRLLELHAVPAPTASGRPSAAGGRPAPP